MVTVPNFGHGFLLVTVSSHGALTVSNLHGFPMVVAAAPPRVARPALLRSARKPLSFSAFAPTHTWHDENVGLTNRQAHANYTVNLQCRITLDRFPVFNSDHLPFDVLRATSNSASDVQWFMRNVTSHTYLLD
jgi:hypothetical protein